MQCFLFEFWDLQLRDLPEIHPDPPYEFQGWCAHMAQGAKVCFVRGNTGDQFADGVLPNLAALGATPTDIMVLNFAVWQNTCVPWVPCRCYANPKPYIPMQINPNPNPKRRQPLYSAFALSRASRRGCRFWALQLLACITAVKLLQSLSADCALQTVRHAAAVRAPAPI